MGKDPAFLIYPNDYLGGTMGFTIIQHGAYWLLLIFQFNNGHFSDNQASEIVGKENFESIKHKFKHDEKNLYFNQRLENEITKRKLYTDSRRKNGRAYLLKKDKPLINKQINKEHMGIPCVAPMLPHMENENEDRNKDEIEFEIPLHLKEIWPAFIEVRTGKKAVNSPRALKMILTELKKLSNDPAIQVKIIEQSIRSSWKDVYPIKDNFAANPKKLSRDESYRRYKDQQALQAQEIKREQRQAQAVTRDGKGMAPMGDLIKGII